MADLKETAEKKLKSRIRKFKKANKDPAEKDKFFEQLGASVEIFLPNKNPEEQSDSILLYTTVDGKVIEAEYAYNEEEDFEQIPLEEKDLKVILNLFSDDFKLDYLELE